MEKCRHPVAFLMAHYQRGVPAALKVGLRHGLFCLGCCWALMLVMFAVGIANLAWMAPLALLMLYEKTGSAGHKIVRPVGMVLILRSLPRRHPYPLMRRPLDTRMQKENVVRAMITGRKRARGQKEQA